MERIHQLLFSKEKYREPETGDSALKPRFSEVYLQGMGACCERVTDLALQATETYQGVVSIEDVQTYTVPVVDEIVATEQQASGNPLLDCLQSHDKIMSESQVSQ